MPSRTYLLQNDPDLDLTLTWEDNWQNITVYFNDVPIDSLASATELKQGMQYLLVPEQVVEIKLRGKFRPRPEILLDGYPVEEHIHELPARGKPAVPLLLLAGTALVLLGLLGEFRVFAVLVTLGFNWFSVLLGIGITTLGISKLALGLSQDDIPCLIPRREN